MPGGHWFDDVVAGEGGLDLFFANAGISMGGVTHELTAAHWDRIIDVNLRGAVNAVLAAYPVMRARGSGHLVLTASGAGLAAPPFVVPYATTKHAVVGLGTGLWPEAALPPARSTGSPGPRPPGRSPVGRVPGATGEVADRG